MPLPSDKWPIINFYDVRTRRPVKVNADRVKVNFNQGSTRGRGAGKYYSVSSHTGSGRKLYKFLSEANYRGLKSRSSSKPMRRASRSRSRTSRSRSRSSSKSMRRASRSRSRSSSRSRSRSSSRSRSRSRRRVTRRRSTKRARRPSKCNAYTSGKARKRKSCLKSPRCSWVSGSKKRGRSRAGYCRRK